MALRAHFHVQIVARQGGARVPGVAATAGDGDGPVIGMDLRFHVASNRLVRVVIAPYFSPYTRERGEGVRAAQRPWFPKERGGLSTNWPRTASAANLRMR